MMKKMLSLENKTKKHWLKLLIACGFQGLEGHIQ